MQLRDPRTGMWRDRYAAAAFGALLLVAVAVCFALGLTGEHLACDRAGAEMHRATHYHVAGGCFVQSGERFVPLSAYRVAAGDGR